MRNTKQFTTSLHLIDREQVCKVLFENVDYLRNYEEWQIDPPWKTILKKPITIRGNGLVLSGLVLSRGNGLVN